MNKCWKKLDLADKASKKEGRHRQKSNTIMAGERFYGSLLSWHFEKGKSYGYVRLHTEVVDRDGQRLVHGGKKLYLSQDGLSLAHQRFKAPGWPFPEGSRLSFKICQWKENDKYFCEDAVLEG